MGMFDYVRCEMQMPVPNDGALGKDAFQTKSLWRCMHQFTITAAGRLIYHEHRYVPGPEATVLMRVHVADVDMDFHGDIEIYGVAKEHALVSYAIRFTRGAVEWIRPFEDLPELHKQWLMVSSEISEREAMAFIEHAADIGDSVNNGDNEDNNEGKR